ncbi:Gfo/Idh/MocA family oxidoreductase [Alphaproteobacteria bacterium]|nr:Gfo/Idh/MocA family oxidoreductase [Alphaproteobacteria bacterium]
MKKPLVKIAQVGAGYWGKNLVRNFSQLGVLAAIVEPDDELGAKLEKEFGVPKRSLSEVLNDPSIIGVSIATPAETHFKIAHEAFSRGKHVFVEKPVSLNIDETECLLRLAERKKLTLMVGHLLQYHPVFQRLLKLTTENFIGDIKHIYSSRLSFGKLRSQENVWWSFAPHDLSMILSLTGSDPVSLTAQGSCHIGRTIEDWVTAQMQFSNGVSAHLNISWLHPFKEHRLVVTGDSGSLVFEDSALDWEKKLCFYPSTVNIGENGNPVLIKGEPVNIMVPFSEPLRNECQHFLDCIKSGKRPLTDGEEGLGVLRVLRAVDQHILTQKNVLSR